MAGMRKIFGSGTNVGTPSVQSQILFPAKAQGRKGARPAPQAPSS
jgi:hypothetical protein